VTGTSLAEVHDDAADTRQPATAPTLRLNRKTVKLTLLPKGRWNHDF
jgi:hypothetical protein